MALLGSAVVINVPVTPTIANAIFTSGALLGSAKNGSIPDTDYAFLAGMTGAQIAAAMGSDYEPPTTVPAPSGSFNTKLVVGIIGQQIAAAVGTTE